MASEELVTVGGVAIEIVRRGHGKPLLLLPGEDMLEAESAFVAGLAKNAEIIIASPPGFGRSARPDWLTEPADQAYLLLSLLKQLGLSRVPVIGCSFGGWVAAEVATKSVERISHVVLADPAGIKTGDREHRDMVDIFGRPQAELEALCFHDPAFARFIYKVPAQ